MKAWVVREKDEFCCTVVFAETRGKAHNFDRYGINTIECLNCNCGAKMDGDKNE